MKSLFTLLLVCLLMGGVKVQKVAYTDALNLNLIGIISYKTIN